ncbi:MAG: DMT family transporter [Treponema sp.]|nr:DMT family transporter [Treponema sp.]
MDYASARTKAFGYLLTAVSILIWGITFVSTKALLIDFSALEILFIRFVLAYALLWVLYPHRVYVKSVHNELLFLMAGFCGVLLYQLLENIAIMYTSASNVSIIVSLCPIFTALIAQLFLHEKHITVHFIAGCAIAIVGVALVSFNGTVQFHFNPRGDILALISGILWGVYSLAVSKINLLGLPPVAVTRRIFFWTVLMMLPLTLCGAFVPRLATAISFLVRFDPQINALRFAHPQNWFNLLFLGCIASAFCFIAWNKACLILGAVRTSIGIYLIPVVTTICAYFLLDEKITVMGIVGMLCTIGGLVISNWKKQER